MERNPLISEFRSAFCEKCSTNTETQGVVVLSADSECEVNEEDKSRILYAVKIIRNIVSSKTGKTPNDVDVNDIRRYSPPLILNAEDDGQLLHFQQFVEEIGFPNEKVVQLGCGPTGVANTKTQFEVVQRDFANASHLTIITSAYHVPRVARTAKKNLDVQFAVLGVPRNQFSDYEVFPVVRGEIRRIKEYSAKGDIAKNL